HHNRQRAIEEDIYRQIQAAKANRGGGSGYEGRGKGRYRDNGGDNSPHRPNLYQQQQQQQQQQRFYPQPPPKQNSKGKNSKHQHWSHPDFKLPGHGQASSAGSSRGGNRSRAGPVQVMFNRATALSDPTMLQDNNDRNHDDDDDDDDDISDDLSDEEEYSSDDMLDRGVDLDDESDEEFLMQQFDWIEEDLQQQDGRTGPQSNSNRQQQTQPQTQQHESDLVQSDVIATTLIEQLPISAMQDPALTQTDDILQVTISQNTIIAPHSDIYQCSTITTTTTTTAAAASPASTVTTTTTETVAKTNTSNNNGVVINGEIIVDGDIDMGITECTAATATFSLASPEMVTEAPEKEPQLLWVMDTSSDAAIAAELQASLNAGYDLYRAPETEVILPVSSKKKKAHRSKRGGIKQREKQMSKQPATKNEEDGMLYFEKSDDEDNEEALVIADYLENTTDDPAQVESLIGALMSLHSGHGHSKDVGGLDPDSSDIEEPLSEDDSQDNDSLDSSDEDPVEDDYDFEQDYDDGFRKTRLGNAVTAAASGKNNSQKKKSRRADELLEEELKSLLPLWQSGAMVDGEGANSRFKPRARGYDVYYDSDETFNGSNQGHGKRKKGKKEPHGGSFDTLVDINRSIEEFVRDRNNDNLHLPPMPKALRRKVHLLCNYYNLRSQSIGSGKRRFPILIKTERTKIPTNPINLGKLQGQPDKELAKLSQQVQGFRGGNGKGKGKHGDWEQSEVSGNGKGGKGMNGRPSRGGGAAFAAPHGSVVGGSAAAISNDNVGHRMLAKMGWSPGVGLGASGEGITQPIEAVVRAKRRGLGHD
ncbi:squalene synthetase-like protein, partial [Lunasporangiospora selenospora]